MPIVFVIAQVLLLLRCVVWPKMRSIHLSSFLHFFFFFFFVFGVLFSPAEFDELDKKKKKKKKRHILFSPPHPPSNTPISTPPRKSQEMV